MLGCISNNLSPTAKDRAVVLSSCLFYIILYKSHEVVNYLLQLLQNKIDGVFRFFNLNIILMQSQHVVMLGPWVSA